MSKATLNLRRNSFGETPAIEIDGQRLDHITTAITIRKFGHEAPTIELDLFLTSVGATIEGDLTINAVPVTDEIGRQIYQALRARYEGAL